MENSYLELTHIPIRVELTTGAEGIDNFAISRTDRFGTVTERWSLSISFIFEHQS